jgi:hypothetical protein
MRQVTISLDETITSNGSFFPVLRAPVYRNKFTNGSVITNKNIGIFALKFQILRNGGDDRSREDPAIFSDTGTLHNGYIGTNPCSFTNFDILVEDGKRIYFNIGFHQAFDVYRYGDGSFFHQLMVGLLPAGNYVQSPGCYKNTEYNPAPQK